MKLGFISERYESGGRGPGTISNVTDDPGGKSYGIYQLSRQTLFDYVKKCPFEFKSAPTTGGFDDEWIKVTERYTAEFALDQRIYIIKHHYLPNIVFARSLGYDTWSRRVQETIFSIAVQHGGAKQIIGPAYLATDDIIKQIEELFIIRWNYVKGLGLSDRLKAALQDRYKREKTDILNIEEQDYGYV